MLQALNQKKMKIHESDTPQLKKQVFQLFDEAFPQDRRWNSWFFDNVYSDDQAVTLVEDGNTVSSLLMQSYQFAFHGSDLQMAYFCGICTAADKRGKGNLSRLMHQALTEAYDREYALAALIPANERLFFVYDRLGFSTTVYVDVERYTSAYRFCEDGYRAVTCDYEIFRRLEDRRSCAVLHDKLQFKHICEDITADGGGVFAVRSENDESMAVAFAVPVSWCDRVEVRDLLATDDKAAEAVLAQVRNRFPNRGLNVFSLPENRRTALSARGMMRIINAEKVLSAIGNDKMAAEQVIRVHDNILPQNNGVYIIGNNGCRRVDETLRRLTLDVDIATLTGIIFSSEKIGSVFGLRTSRAAMPLMLD